MPRTQVPTREGPKREISTVVEPHNRPWTPPKESDHSPRGTKQELIAKDFQAAKDDLARMDASGIGVLLEYMFSLPMARLEMVLLAEEVGKNRPEVLKRFPKPGRRARERYLGTPA